MTRLQLLVPPEHAWQLLVWEVTGGGDLKAVRTGLEQFFTADDADRGAGPGDLGQRIALVATELAGNALRHGLPPVTVRLLRDEDCYLLVVSDHRPDRAPELAGRPERISAGGRGLFIARSLALRVCWYRTAESKHVWAAFPAAIGPAGDSSSP